MLITRECDYAVRVLRAMAEEKRVSVNEICEKELITAPFAYKILKKLQVLNFFDNHIFVRNRFFFFEDRRFDG